MKGSLAKIVIIVVGISLTSATLFTAYTMSGQPKVYSYIPSDSEFVSHFSYSNGSYYMFATTNSYAVITGTPVIQVENAISKVHTTNGTSNISIKTAMSYHDYSIFEISGISLSEVMKVLGISVFNNSVPLPFGSLSVYVTDLTTKFSIIGSLNGILSSIDSSLHNTGFTGLKTYVNENIPFSSAFFLHNTSLLSRITMNVTSTSTFVTVYSKNPVLVPIMLNVSNFVIGVRNLSEQSITFEIGIGWLEIQSMLGSLINSVSQNGGLNVKNNTGIPVLF